MKGIKKTFNLLENCKLLIILSILSIILSISGWNFLFKKFNIDIFTYTMSIFFVLISILTFIKISYTENINVKSAAFKTLYYIYCFTLITLSWLLYNNLNLN